MTAPIDLSNEVFSELLFDKDGYNLKILEDEGATEVITVGGFFQLPDAPTQILAKDDSGNVQTYTFANDVYIRSYGDEDFNIFNGTTYNDIMFASRVNKTINPNSGKDTIYSNSKPEDTTPVTVNNSAGDDTYYSGEGRDIFISGTGSNTFVFSKEKGGIDTLQSATSSDTLTFEDVHLDELSFEKVNQDLCIFYENSYIRIVNYYDADGNLNPEVINDLKTINDEGETVTTHLTGITPSENYFDTADFSELVFQRTGNNLQVNLGETEKIYNNFFDGSPVEYVLTKDENGDIVKHNIKSEALIETKISGYNDFEGTDYNESFSAEDGKMFSGELTGGKGDDIVTLSKDDYLCLNFRKGDGNDTIIGADRFSSMSFENVSYDDFVFEKDENDFIIHYGDSSVRLKDYYNTEKPIYEMRFSNNASYGRNIDESLAYVDNCYFAEDFTKGKMTVNQSSKVVAKNYISDSEKGVTINSKNATSDDFLVGSYYNDKITAKGGNNIVKEFGGKNTIKTGNGHDSIRLYDTSSNTVNAGNGYNAFLIYSVGINNVTGGKDNDNVQISAGYNTVNLKSGSNYVDTYGGVNKITTGKDTDNFYIYGGNNVIKSGDGRDTFIIGNTTLDYGPISTQITAGKGDHLISIHKGINSVKLGASVTTNDIRIYDGVNTIDASKATSEFQVYGGTNTIKGGKGDDYYRISNIYDGATYITDKKGNDTYNFKYADYDEIVTSVNDTKGDNKYEFSKDIYDKNVYFEINLAKNHKKDATNNYKYSVGKSVLFTTFENGDIADTGIEMVMDKKNQVGTITVYEDKSDPSKGSDSYRLAINEVAQSVANWLGSKQGYNSTADVLALGSTETINEMLALYGTVDNCLNKQAG